MSAPITAQDIDKVTRLVVVDHRPGMGDRAGVVLEAWDARVTLSFQDDGRTLKVFVG